jgi:hypothetical protein
VFTGHLAVAFAVKKLAPRSSLGTMFLATQFVDLLWCVLLLAGIEHVRIAPGITRVMPFDLYDYPISHSLMTGLLWSAAFGLIYYRLKKYSRGALVLGGLVFSHWVLDFLVHRPDLPLYPCGHILVGLSLWNSILWSVVTELGLFSAGVWLYSRITVPLDRRGRYGLWLFMALLLVLQVISYQGAPPPSVESIAWVGLAGGTLNVLWAWWIDRHRRVKEREQDKK